MGEVRPRRLLPRPGTFSLPPPLRFVLRWGGSSAGLGVLPPYPGSYRARRVCAAARGVAPTPLLAGVLPQSPCPLSARRALEAHAAPHQPRLPSYLLFLPAPYPLGVGPVVMEDPGFGHYVGRPPGVSRINRAKMARACSLGVPLPPNGGGAPPSSPAPSWNLFPTPSPPHVLVSRGWGS